MKILNMLILNVVFILFAANQSSYGQFTPLPYYENFDSAATVRWTSYILGTENPDDLPWAITIHNAYSQQFSMMHTCNTGTPQADNWTVCKLPFSFTAGGKIDSIRTWLSSANPPSNADTIGIYLLTGNINPNLATSKTLLLDFRGPNFQTDLWVKTSGINIPAIPGQSYIAFRYKTANNCINVFLDNLHLSANNPTNINPVFTKGNQVQLYPNPAADNLNINTNEHFDIINIYDVIGTRVYTQSFQTSIHISSLPKGIYTLELIDGNKQRSFRKFVRQ